MIAIACLSLTPPPPRATPSVSRRAALAGVGPALLGAGAPALLGSPAFAAEADEEKNIYRLPAGSQTGRTVLITGANVGLGLETAKRLAAADATVVISARSKSKVEAAEAAVREAAPGARVLGVELDLAELASVRGLPARLNAIGVKAIDVLVLNAGVMAIPERLSTADGFERTLGVNHLGHYALTAQLLPQLRRAKDGFRVVAVSSAANSFATASGMRSAIDAGLETTPYSQWGSYGLSKAANILFVKELQRRLDENGVKGAAVALHPGVVQTELPRYLVGGVEKTDAQLSVAEMTAEKSGLEQAAMRGAAAFVWPVERGANTQVWLAAAADSGGVLAADGGRYFDDMREASPNPLCADADLARALWEKSAALTGARYEF